jgi:hypothetical protein
MKIRMNTTLIGITQPLYKGAEYTLPDDEAKDLIARGLAVPVATSARVETAVSQSAPETRIANQKKPVKK